MSSRTSREAAQFRDLLVDGAEEIPDNARARASGRTTRGRALPG
jgi:hypothetical protein